MNRKNNKPTSNRTTPHNKKVAVIWTRVSTKDQAENNLSLETQERACKDYAFRYGIDIERIMGQTNESAKTEGRLYQEMITYVSLHRNINTILVYSFDRFSRAGAEAIVTKAYLKSKGITVVSVTQPIDNDNMAGEFLENIIFLFNQFENNLRKEKCTAGMIECLERGEWYTKPPVGYEIDRKAKEKHRFIITEKGELIKMAFKWRAYDGLTEIEILKRLRNLGWDLYVQRLSAIFHNPFYCGKIRHNLLHGRVVNGIHPPIIDEATFNIVNGLGTHIGVSHADETPRTPLRLLVRCDNCCRFFTGYEVKKKHLFYYKCNGRECRSNVSAKTMHQQFCELLDEFKLPKEIIPGLTTILSSIIQQYCKEAELLQQQEIEQKMKFEDKIREVTTRYGVGEIPEDVYAISKANLNRKIDEIDAKINALKTAQSNHDIDVEKAIVTVCNLSTYWSESSFDVRQKIQKFSFPTGLNFNKKTGFNLTKDSNELLMIFHSISDSYNKGEDIKKEENLSKFLSCSAYGNRTRMPRLRILYPNR